MKLKYLVILALIPSVGVVYAADKKQDDNLHVINYSNNDLQYVVTYLNKGKGLVEEKSECIPANSKIARVIPLESDSYDEKSFPVFSAYMYQYDSNNGSCSTPGDQTNWPTYYQAEKVIQFSADDLNGKGGQADEVHYRVMRNSQDTTANKASPVLVKAYHSDKKSEDDSNTISTYGAQGSIYYFSNDGKNHNKGLAINNGELYKYTQVGDQDNLFNEGIYVLGDKSKGYTTFEIGSQYQ
ncbi:hypothetical protein OAO18_03830 [Francisellaceae bacterium]|nr:hypothetical protein [Francisellaceae bacterium]